MADVAHAHGDDHSKPHHDYHLVDPSPWPIIGSASAFLMAVGAITWMHHMVSWAPFIFFAGTLGVLFTMLSWWRDVAIEATYGGYHTRVVQISHRYGMILFIASEVMFFVAWFWAYFSTALFPGDSVHVLRNALFACGSSAPDVVEMCKAHGAWPPVAALNHSFTGTFDPWHLPLLNTLILLTSGTTVTWAHHALLENDRDGLKWGLICTIVLGLLFTSVQAYEYMHAGFLYSGHIYGATFFMATGFHGAHVIIGTTFLIVCLIRAYLGHFTPEQHLGFEFCAWYWHFVDVVWLFLFACIYVWGAGAAVHGAH